VPHALSIALLLAVQTLAQPEAEAPPAEAPTLETLQGVWAYDFDHLAQRGDIKELADSGRLKHILDYQGRTTWEFDGDTLAVRGGRTVAHTIEPTFEDGRLLTNIEDARHATPLTLRSAGNDTLVAGFAEFDEHPAFRFVRLTGPGSDAVGRWTGQGEHEDVRLVVTETSRVLLTGAGERRIASATVEADGLEHRLDLDDGDDTQLELTIDADLAGATLEIPGEDPISLRRSYDPMEWIEGTWIIEPAETRALPFYQIWPEAFGNPAPPLDAVSAFFVRNGMHFGQLPMKPHSTRGDIVVFQVNEGDAASLLPFKRLDEHHTETLILKLVLRAGDAPPHTHDHDHAGHDHDHDHDHDHGGHGHDHPHDH
jgi:hypothetical protein